MPAAKPAIAARDYKLARQMVRKCMGGWYIGDQESLLRHGAIRDVIGRTDPSLSIRLMLTRDRMHHSVGWWRNAEYEYCWHLSISAWDREPIAGISPRDQGAQPADIPDAEERYWTFAIFPQTFDKLWHEPGGTDPRQTPAEKMLYRHFAHLRLFLDPETFEPFIPHGEVYDFTRWIPGLTPEKVDR